MKSIKLLLLLLIIQPLAAQSWVQAGNTLFGAHPGDSFGRAVSMSADGTTIAISSPQNDVNGTDSGKTAIYRILNNQWTQVGNDINGGSIYNYSGEAIKLSEDGQTLVIGSATDHDPQGHWYGSARIFRWDGTNWVQKGTTLYGTTYGAYFGISVGISEDGNTILVAADENNLVRAYQWDASLGWVQKGSNVSLGTGYYGEYIDLTPDGNTFIVGNDNLNNTGKVGVFSWNGTNWVQKGAVFSGVADENLGHNVCINADGNVLLIGSPLNDNNGSNTGEIKLYQWDGTAWIQKGQTFNGTLPSNNLAATLDSSGNTFSYWSVINTTTLDGALRIYSWDGTQWVQKGVDLDGGNGDNTGVNYIGMTADGNTMAVGFPYDFYFDDGMDNGRVKIYHWPDGLGTGDHDNSPAFTFYPNPATDKITFSQDVKTVTVCDISGRIVSDYTINGTEMNVAALADGTYILKVSTEKGISQFKFIKK